MCYWANNSDYWSGAGGAVLGGLIGAGGSFLGVCFVYWMQSLTEGRRRKLRQASLLHSLYDEMTTTWNIYKIGIGATVEEIQTGKPFAFFYPVSQEGVFMVFNNTDVAEIDDKELRRGIITTYVYARGLIETFRMNNALIDAWQQAVNQANSSNPQGPDNLRKLAEARANDLASYSSSILKYHHLVEDELKKVLARFRQLGIGDG